MENAIIKTIVCTNVFNYKNSSEWCLKRNYLKTKHMHGIKIKGHMIKRSKTVSKDLNSSSPLFNGNTLQVLF